jgi:hypothetical protein
MGSLCVTRHSSHATQKSPNGLGCCPLGLLSCNPILAHNYPAASPQGIVGDMKSPDRIGRFLAKLSKPERYSLALFLGVLAQKRTSRWRREHRILSTLLAADFEDAGMALDQIEGAIKMLSGLYADIYPITNTGLANMSPLPPRLQDKAGKLTITNLSRVPVEDLLIELASTGNAPVVLWKKIPICISEKKGIYRPDRPALRYEIRGNRLQLVLRIVEGNQPEIEEAVERANVLREVNAINNFFKEKLGVAADLVDHSNTSGYFLNEDAYEIMIERFSTELTTD